MSKMRQAFKAHWDRKPIAIDFDTPIHNFSQGYINQEIYDGPTPGVEMAITKLLKEYAVFILTARDTKQVIKWSRREFPGIKFELIPRSFPDWQKEGVVGITNIKLPAITYIDDRALRFTNWNDMLKYFL